MIKPITPEEMPKISDRIPDEVISSVNTEILKKWNGEEAIVYQDDLISEVINTFSLMSGTRIRRDEVFDRGYMNIEECFSKAGWDVKYKSPDRGDYFKAFFKFTKRTK